MNIFEKLQEARIKLHATELKKTGRNSFSNYSYFELADFLPQTLRLFQESKLCGVVSYTSEMATLTIYDMESDAKIIITSPMGKAALKGCHDVQNIGAVETYQRRYLWITAMEIIENDQLDAGEKDKKPPELQMVSAEQIESIKKLATEAKVSIKTILDAAKVNKLEQIPAYNFNSIIKKLNVTIKQDKAAAVQDEGRDWE